METIRKRKDNKKIDFKRIVFTKRDVEEEMERQTQNGFTQQQCVIRIPDEVKEIVADAFFNNQRVVTIDIPESVKIIPMKCFEFCQKLINITIPLNETRVVIGNKIFNNQPHFNQSILLPSSIKVINGIDVFESTSIEIPSHVTSIDEKCFDDCFLFNN